MTLHIAVNLGPFVVIVGDRLLTTEAARGRETWDPYANKTILVRAENGIVVISYSGAALVGGRQTDEWLCEAIAGSEAWPPGADQSLMHIGPVAVRLGPMLDGIQDAISRDFVAGPHASRANGLDLLVSGHTWSRDAHRSPGRIKMFSASLRQPAASEAAATWRRETQRFSFTKLGPCVVGLTGAGDQIDAANSVQRAIQAWVHDGQIVTPGLVERHLANYIRARAGESVGIGLELMSVWVGVQTLETRLRFLRTPGSARDAFGPALILSDGPRRTGMTVRPSLLNVSSGVEVRAAGVTAKFETEPPIEPDHSTRFGHNPRRRE